MSKITESAKNQDCQIRIPGICTFDPEKTSPAHLGGAGMAKKTDDLFIAYACYDCHMAVDGHIKTDYTKDELKLMFFEGMARTQKILLESNLVKI